MCTNPKIGCLELHVGIVRLLLICLCVIIPFTGCAGGLKQWWHNGHKVGPNYRRPAVPYACNWIDADKPQLIGQPVNPACWWMVYNDPILNKVVHCAYQQNLPLREAGLRILESRSLLSIAQANMFPQSQQAYGGYTRTQLSKARFPATPGSPRAFDTYQVGLIDASWEIDVWGRLSRTIESASAAFDASVEDYDAVLVMLLGDVASTYMRIRTLEQQLAYNRQNIEIQGGAFKIAQSRLENGDVSALDVEQAQTNLSATRAQTPQLEIELRQNQNALCVLLGMPPHGLRHLLGVPAPAPPDNKSIVEPWLIPVAPSQVAVGIPADLVRRRPDVRRAERRVAEQSARIGIAYADLFPTFTVTGSIEYTAAELSGLFGPGSQAGFLGAPVFRWNILNYGRLRDNIRVQDARFQQSIVAYQHSVLVASREVEDNLVSFWRSQERYQAELEATEAAKRAADLAQVQYSEGAIDFNRVFTLQANLVEQQQNLAEASEAINLGLIGAYRALGGGWQIRLGSGNTPVNWPESTLQLFEGPEPFEVPESLPMPVEEPTVPENELGFQDSEPMTDPSELFAP